jgi:2-dehydropantoate 2-reductase
MRFVIFGAGAIGGSVAARLAQSGFEVAVIARGAHLAAIRRAGLVFETPEQRTVLELPAAEDPAELGVGADGDVLLLATKSQDTAGGLAALRLAGARDVPIVCLQNGVDNERVALRLFESVYGAVVMLPAAHLEPGIVQAYGARLTGIVDVGRYPEGADELCDAVTAALEASGFSSRSRTDIMRYKCTGTIETDYLNGEVVLVGRLHGVPTPVNAALCELAARQVVKGEGPGRLTADDVLAVAAVPR